jgi:hypothetical protein
MSEKKKILMVCLGNICRSPVAEGIMLKLIEEKQLNAILIQRARPVITLAKLRMRALSGMRRKMELILQN